MIRSFVKILFFVCLSSMLLSSSRGVQDRIERWVFPQAVVGPSTFIDPDGIRGSVVYRIELRISNTGDSAWSGFVRLLEGNDLQPMQNLRINGENVVDAGAVPVNLQPRASMFLRVVSSAETATQGILVIDGADDESPADQVVPSFNYRVLRIDGVTTDLVAVPPASPAELLRGVVVRSRRGEGGRENFQVGLAVVAEADFVGRAATSAPSAANDLTVRLYVNGRAEPFVNTLDLRGGQTAILLEQLFPSLLDELAANPELLDVDAYLEIESSPDLGPVYGVLIGFGEIPDFEDIQNGVVPFLRGNFAPVAVDDEFGDVGSNSADNLLDVLSNDSDRDGDPVTIVMVQEATDQGGSAEIFDGLVSYSPPSDFSGEDTFTYRISDGRATDAATVRVTVLENSDPEPQDDQFTVEEDSGPDSLDVLENDTDPENNPLTVVEVSTASAGGLVDIAPGGGSVIYAPAQDFAGEETFTYTVSDARGGSATANVTVTVNPVNDAPVAVDDVFGVAEDSPEGPLDVLANDTDIDSSVLTVAAVGATSAGGTATPSPDGQSVLYRPAPDFNGVETFTYEVRDDQNAAAMATVTVTVSAANDAPQAVDDTASVEEDSGETSIPVLENDIDIDGDDLTVSSVGTPSAGGSARVAPDGGSVLYQPAADFAGTETFTYNVTDGLLGDTATVTVTVVGVNDPPVARDDQFRVSNDAVDAMFNVLANDTDVDQGDTLVVLSVGTPDAGGTASVASGGGGVLYTPATGFEGTETFTYVVSDGTASAMATVTVEVVAASTNQPPMVNAGPDLRVPIQDDQPELRLDGTVTDDGLPAGNLSIQWSMISGPGQVVFMTPFSERTFADFPVTGTYELELMANDNALAASDRVIVIIDPSSQARVRFPGFEHEESRLAGMLSILAGGLPPGLWTRDLHSGGLSLTGGSGSWGTAAPPALVSDRRFEPPVPGRRVS